MRLYNPTHLCGNNRLLVLICNSIQFQIEIQVDFEDPHRVLKHLVRVCLVCDLTLMLAWNAHEAGKIIETYKIYENKPPDLIMERQESDVKIQVNILIESIDFVEYFD